jgi:hypothetical protein
VKLGTQNRKQLIFAGVLGAVLVLILVYQFIPSSSTSASTSTGAAAPVAAANPVTSVLSRATGSKASKSSATKKEKLPQSLDPTLQLQQLAVIEQIKYEGSGRNIFISEADPVIPTPLAPGQTGPGATTPEAAKIYTPPSQPAPAPIPLKFFGFASKPGEPKKIFLSKGEDVFIAGEGEVIDRRYKVVRISATSVDIQDVVSSGPPQSIPLTQG